MPPRIDDSALPLSEGELSRLQDDRCALSRCLVALGLNVVYSRRDGMRNHSGVGRSTDSACVGDDHRPVANGQLRTVVFADP